MKAWFGAWAIVAALSAGVSPAAAQSHAFGAWVQAQAQMQKQPNPPPQRDPRRQKRAEPQRDDRQRNSLTDEERRGLRRDIDQANRDIYRRQRSR